MALPGLPARRSWSGVAVAVAGLAACTAVVLPLEARVSLAEAALLYLIPVVAATAVGGVWAGLAGVAGADLIVNFLFIPPYHSFVVESLDQAIVLTVYAMVTAAIASAVEIAARQRARAARRDLEADLLALATSEPVADQSLSRLLEHIRATFAMSAVALLESDPGGERAVAAAGTVPVGRPATYATAGAGLRLAGWGSKPVGDDRRALTRLAGAAARTLEAQRLADEAGRARELAEIDHVRAALLAAVGHDFRSPLAGIKAAVSSLRHPDLRLPAEAQADLLATIEESADCLSDIVENLLSMSRLQAGRLSVRLEAVAIDGVVARASLHAAADRSRIEVDVPDRLPLASTDPGLLERVLVNLITNAVAASPTGRPVRVHAVASDDRILLRVIDNGPGVPAADRERMFVPFQRLHDRGHGGLGLGLAIARGFSDAVGATLVVGDTPGGGLTMTVAVPVLRKQP